jgi:hypothetical protein
MYTKCPYCFEDILDRPTKCPICQQFLLDEPLIMDYQGAEKKSCIFCGKKIFKEARVCKHCNKWIDEVDQSAQDLKDMED